MASEVTAGEAATMPQSNGVLYPPPSDDLAEPSTPGKRKRASTPEEKPIVDQNFINKSSQENKVALNQNLRYILQIVSQDDEHPSIFQSSLIPSSTTPSKFRSKRPRLSDDASASDNIRARVDANLYTSYHGFLDDVEKASAIAIETSTPNHAEDISSMRTRIDALKTRCQALVHQTFYQETSQNKIEPSTTDYSPPGIVRCDKKILTLYGGSSSNAKQLFSSLQKSDVLGSASEKPPTFPEDRLPNGITTTQAIPFNLEVEQKPVKTFGEVFAPRSTLAQLQPPRPGPSWARDDSSAWVDPFDAITKYDSVLGQKHHYSFARLPSGYWLHYGGDTALSSYWDRQDEQMEATGSNVLPRSVNEDTALLFGAYSSFAPSFDSSHAVIQSDDKNRTWWTKRGSKRFSTIFALENMASSDEELGLPDLNEATLEQDIKSFIEESSSMVKSEDTDEASRQAMDVDSVLSDIAELLQTLDSFRRNRNLQYPTPGESKTNSKTDSSVTPSAEELATYEILKSGLAAIISNLPPYAVAKLNGDQLAELNISQRIVVGMPTFNGTMEEDDYSLLQQRLAAAVPAATPSRTGSFQATSGYNQRMYSANARPQQSVASPQTYYQGRPSSSAPYTPGVSTPQQNYSNLRPGASPSHRPSNASAYTPGQHQSRPTPNGYAPYSGHSTTSPAPNYQQNPPYAAGRSASPQKPHAYATPQGGARTAYLNPPLGNTQRYYSQQAGNSPVMYGNSQSTTPAAGQYTMSPNVAAAYNRNAAAEQAMALARQKAQIEASRRVSSTPNPISSIAHASSQERSASPATKLSATPTPGRS